jgi:hypothetical protein
MTMDTRDSHDLVRRVARIERENRWLKTGVIAMAVAAGSMLWMGSSGPNAGGGGGDLGRFKEVSAGHIVLRDADGQMRAWLGIAEGGPRLIFFDQSGQQRLGVGMTKEAEPALGIFDGGENPRVIVGMVEGWPGMVFRDPQGKKRVAMLNRDEWATLYFYDRQETKRTGIGLFGDAAALNLCDDRGKDRTGLTSDRKGSSLSFFDMGGAKRVGLGTVLTTDEPALGFFDHEGNAQASLAVLNEEPSMCLYGTNRMEAVMTAGRTNKPAVSLYGPERTLIWHAP